MSDLLKGLGHGCLNGLATNQQHIFKISPVTNRNAAQIKVAKKNLLSSSVYGVPTLSYF
jgi:hypothetical protein